MTSILIAILMMKSTALAGIADSCKLTEQARLALTVHGANILNATTTRTPEGGPYKFQSLLCGKTCTVKQELRVRNEYRPDHPDANSAGYVQAPDIDKSKEIAAVNTYAAVLRNTAGKCAAAKVVDNGSSMSVSYPGSDTLVDIFNFKNLETESDLPRVVSWIHIDRKGARQIFNF